MLNISEKLVRIIKVHGAGSIAGGVEVDRSAGCAHADSECLRLASENSFERAL